MKWNLDVIIVVSYFFKKLLVKVKEEILNDFVWKGIKVVKEGRVYVMLNDGESWDYFVLKWVFGFYWFVKVFYLEFFGDFDVRVKVDDFY